MNRKQIACALAFALGNASMLAAQDSAAAPAPAVKISVTEALIAKSVVDRAPQDTGAAFPADVGQVVCWTRVSGAAGGETIHHVWFHGDDQVGDVTLTVGGSPWRTWSRKTVPADATGPWHVEIRDASGNMVRRVDFTIGG
jgi:DUF2914 family protein